MRIVSSLFLLIVVLLGISFATLNSEVVNVNYYVAHKSLPLSLLLTIVFAFGCLLGIIVCLWIVVRAKVKNYRCQQQLRLAEKEIENLRAIPLHDKH